MSLVAESEIASEIERLHWTLSRGNLMSVKVLTLEEFAAVFRVGHKTAGHWIAVGKLPHEAYFRTPGGHHRVFEVYAHKLLVESGITDAEERSSLIKAARRRTAEVEQVKPRPKRQQAA